jgi:DNA-binding transcriptional LysR family regulator
MDKLKAMQTFVQIADSGSLTGAALRMNASLPAVVRTLAALESSLGVRLFNRTTRRIALTAEGQIYLDRCRSLLIAVEEAESALCADAVEPVGRIAITAPVLFGQMFVAPAITRFAQRYAKVQCSVYLFDRLVSLIDEGMDIGVRIGVLDDSSLIAQQVGTLRRVVVASPEYVAKYAAVKHPKDLLKVNCVRFIGTGGNWWTFYEGNQQFTVPVTGNLDFNHAEPAVEACLMGMGYGMFISYQVAPYLADGRLTVLLEEFEPAPRPVNIVYPHARLLPARTKVLIDWLKQALSATS